MITCVRNQPSFTNLKRLVTLVALTFCVWPAFASAKPPYDGTIWTRQDIIRPSDPSVFENMKYVGIASRTMFDRRVNDWITVKPFLFKANFSDGLKIEVQVNPEFVSPEKAEKVALKYMHAIGQLPTIMRKHVKTIWIHDGNQAFGGGNQNILIHTDQAADYIRRGNFEEALFHEAVHTSLDKKYAQSSAWLSAQKADGAFISKYAEDFPKREDLAESVLLGFAAIHYPNRLSSSGMRNIQRIMPNRLQFVEKLFPANKSLFTNKK